MTMLKHKDVLGLFELDAEEIDEILTVGMSMKKLLRQNIKKLPHLGLLKRVWNVSKINNRRLFR